MQRRIEEHEITLKERNKYFILLPPNDEKSHYLNDEDLKDKNLVSTAITDETHFEKLNELVTNSTNNIKLATFIFDDIKTAKLLIEKSKILKGGVYVLTSVLDRNLRYTFGYTKDQENKHLEVLRLLENSPVALRCISGLHAKFWIFDDKISVVTSSNLTINSLNNVPELGLILENKDSINYIDYLFNRLWFEFPSRIMENGNLSSISGLTKSLALEINKPDNIYPYYKINGVSNNLNSLDWFNKFHELINQATLSIKIATWSISLKKTELKDLLLKKLKDGITIELLISERCFKRDYKIRDFLFKTKNKFNKFNYHIHSSNHCKFVIIDEKNYFLSTKNYDAPNTFPQSIELGVLFYNNSKLNDIWMKLVHESLKLEFKESKRDFLHHVTYNSDLNIYEENLYIWIWHPNKPVYNWLQGPNLSDISNKIKNSNVIYLLKLHNETKILQVYNDYNLILSKDNRLIRLENNRLDKSNMRVDHKWVLGSEKLVFMRYKES